MKYWSVLAAMAILLGGCVTPRAGTGVAPSAERSVMDQEPANESQAAAKIHIDLGMAYLQVGRYDVALDEAKIALRYDGNYAPAYHLMALVYMFLEDAPAARSNFELAIGLAPNDPEFNNSYGWFQCVNGHKEDGLQRLAMAARNPYYRTPTRPYTNAGLCLLRSNEEDAALEQFQRAVQADPANLPALYQLAQISYRRADYPAARRYLVQLHQQGEPSAETVWLGLRTERRLGNREAEASYASQLKSRFPDAAQTRLMMQGSFE